MMTISAIPIRMAAKGLLIALMPAGTGTPAIVELSENFVIIRFTMSTPCQNTSLGLMAVVPAPVLPIWMKLLTKASGTLGLLMSQITRLAHIRRMMTAVPISTASAFLSVRLAASQQISSVNSV